MNKEQYEYILKCNWDKTSPVMRNAFKQLFEEKFEVAERLCSELLEENKKLREEGLRLSRMIHNEKDGVFRIRQNGTLVELNMYKRSVFFYENGEMIDVYEF